MFLRPSVSADCGPQQGDIDNHDHPFPVGISAAPYTGAHIPPDWRCVIPAATRAAPGPMSIGEMPDAMRMR